MCRAHCLNETAKWIGELVTKVHADGSDAADSSMSDGLKYTDALPEIADDGANANFNHVFFEKPCEQKRQLGLARTLFDLREYRKCAFVLEKATS